MVAGLAAIFCEYRAELLNLEAMVRTGRVGAGRHPAYFLPQLPEGQMKGDDFTGTKIASFTFMGAKHSAKAWKDMSSSYSKSGPTTTQKAVRLKRRGSR